jgi:GNAT superfamily N-acetyltransferase
VSARPEGNQPGTIEIRPATTDADLGHVARIVSTVSPDAPTTVEDMRWADEKYPGGHRFLAWLDGEAVGAAGVGRVYIYPPDFDGLWTNISVLRTHRRRGAGSSLLAAVSQAARDAGKSSLLGQTRSDRPEAIAFLEHRGFRETDRMKVVRLDLPGLAVPIVDPPAGVEITSLEAHPELVAGVYEAAKEILPDIPGDGPVAPETIEEFRVRDVDGPRIPHGAFKIAIEAETGRVVGYANLGLIPGNPRLAWHMMTGVARAWRGRGLATALKRATIVWAIEHELEAIEGSNDVDNAPMRAVNRRLGYQPEADFIGVRGPLAPPLL